jgi:hypothetical protein
MMRYPSNAPLSISTCLLGLVSRCLSGLGVRGILARAIARHNQAVASGRSKTSPPPPAHRENRGGPAHRLSQPGDVAAWPGVLRATRTPFPPRTHDLGRPRRLLKDLSHTKRSDRPCTVFGRVQARQVARWGGPCRQEVGLCRSLRRGAPDPARGPSGQVSRLPPACRSRGDRPGLFAHGHCMIRCRMRRHLRPGCARPRRPPPRWQPAPPGPGRRRYRPAAPAGWHPPPPGPSRAPGRVLPRGPPF